MNDEIDWSFWQNSRGIKVWEACLLSMDINPSIVRRSDERLLQTLSSHSPYRSNGVFQTQEIQTEYGQRLRMVSGYLNSKDTFNPVSKFGESKYTWEIHLYEFSKWAQDKKLVIPAGLEKVTDATMPKVHSPSIPFAELMPSSEKTFGNRERENMLRVIVGMAIKGYGYNPNAGKNTAIKEIVNDLAVSGIQISDDTLRSYLRDGARLMEDRKPA